MVDVNVCDVPEHISISVLDKWNFSVRDDNESYWTRQKPDAFAYA